MENFHSLGLPEPLLRSLDAMSFSEPTPIQAKAIPLALEGRDILGSAQTGTGKTGAFGIPLLAMLMETRQGTAMVITPTRELATQVMQALKEMLGEKSRIKTALMIGGESMGKQLSQLRNRPRLFVGTPGRINDHLRRGTLDLSENNFLVLDETDRMLDMGFSVQVEEIIKHMPKKRQTMLFSATLPNNIVKLAERYMNEPVRIAIGSTINPAENIKQDIRHVSETDKYGELLSELDSREGSVIIFVKTKHGADRMAKRLRDQKYKTDSVHGDLKHTRREKVIKDFRDKKYRILVATDVAARGLDIPHIEHVINYDMPQCPEDYIHRIGRTARAGASGEALCLVTPADKSKWSAIVRMMNPGEANNNKEEKSSGKKSQRAKRFIKKPFAKKDFSGSKRTFSKRRDRKAA